MNCYYIEEKVPKEKRILFPLTNYLMQIILYSKIKHYKKKKTNYIL